MFTAYCPKTPNPLSLHPSIFLLSLFSLSPLMTGRSSLYCYAHPLLSVPLFQHTLVISVNQYCPYYHISLLHNVKPYTIKQPHTYSGPRSHRARDCYIQTYPSFHLTVISEVRKNTNEYKHSFLHTSLLQTTSSLMLK